MSFEPARYLLFRLFSSLFSRAISELGGGGFKPTSSSPILERAASPSADFAWLSPRDALYHSCGARGFVSLSPFRAQCAGNLFFDMVFVRKRHEYDLYVK